ncbi:hypothetical protein C2I17_08495 [Niallia circulans]|nr:hypothetical protein C2I17_08495 [Niallia circulans]
MVFIGRMKARKAERKEKNGVHKRNESQKEKQHFSLPQTYTNSTKSSCKKLPQRTIKSVHQLSMDTTFDYRLITAFLFVKSTS